MKSTSVRLTFDNAHLDTVLAELALYLKAFDTFESIPESIRSVIDECLSGRGFEFTCVDAGAAIGAGERLAKVQLSGRLLEVLATLRTLQGNASGHRNPRNQSSSKKASAIMAGIRG
jgi:hypothetical protein